MPADLSVMASHRIGRQNYGSLFVRQADGRYRSQSLMPEHEYEIRVSDGSRVYDRAGRASEPPGERVRRIVLPSAQAAEVAGARAGATLHGQDDRWSDAEPRRVAGQDDPAPLLEACPPAFRT